MTAPGVHGQATRQANRARWRIAHGPSRPGRAIGPAGTIARVVVGSYALGLVIAGAIDKGFRPASWVLGLVVLPGVQLLVAWLRARRHPSGMRATGPVGHAVNLAVFGALYATPWYAPSVGFTGDAALLFYGASMVLAAVRGYAGCEVMAVSNWLLRRDDQVGCILFAPADALERGVTPPKEG